MFPLDNFIAMNERYVPRERFDRMDRKVFTRDWRLYAGSFSGLRIMFIV